jgi:hypothetical protein
MDRDGRQLLEELVRAQIRVDRRIAAEEAAAAWSRKRDIALKAVERALVPSASRIIGSSTAIGALLSIIFWLSSASSDTPPMGYMLVIGLIAGAAVGFDIARALTRVAIWKLSSNSPVRRLWYLPAILGALCPLTGPLFGMAVSLANLWTAMVLGVLVGCVVSALRFKSLTDQAALHMSRAAEETAGQIRRSSRSAGTD